MARVTLDVKDHVATVTLNRADKMNALDPEMIAGIIAAGEELRGRDDVRAVVLTGSGNAFCAGLDVASFGALASQDDDEKIMARTYGAANDYQHVSLVWREVPVPVIAALHGVVFGGGFQIALGADIRIAAPETRFAIMEMKWGLVPDMGGMVLLPPLMRSDFIRKYTYTAAQFTTEDAAAAGVVTEVDADPLARAQALAAEIAGKSPSAIRAAKRLIAVAESKGAEDVLWAESREQADLVGRPHQMEVIAANLQKRAANFG